MKYLETLKLSSHSCLIFYPFIHILTVMCIFGLANARPNSYSVLSMNQFSTIKFLVLFDAYSMYQQLYGRLREIIKCLMSVCLSRYIKGFITFLFMNINSPNLDKRFLSTRHVFHKFWPHSEKQDGHQSRFWIFIPQP